MVSNCPLFYSDEDEIIELPPPEPEVVEVAPLQHRRKNGEAVSNPGVSSQRSISRFYCI